jgi:imidazole glycerol-phosphate synthase subunit HisH
MIAILDYGAGNLRSVVNALVALGVRHEVVRDAAGLDRASKIILPGVGHFGQMMRELDRMRVREVLVKRIRAGVPFLGICLGLQALFERSQEAPQAAGLGLFSGEVQRFPGDVRVPHMGWNKLEVGPAEPRLLRNVGPAPWVYFAHSYYVPVVAGTAAQCSYGVPFTAALEHENILAVQFHPEKSSQTGLRIVQNFVELQ